jgi:hypothetical protein
VLRKKEKVHKPKRRKDKYFLVFLLALSISNALAQSPSPNGEGDLSSIEDKIFHQQYANEKKEDRVSRIEEFLFGVKSNKPYDERLNKIVKSLKVNEIPRPDDSPAFGEARSQSERHLLSPPTRPEVRQGQPVVPAKSSAGVLGTISDIEKKVLGKTYNDLSFQSRVEQLEEKMLSGDESANAINKPLLERVTVLVKRAGVNNQPIEDYKTIRPNINSNSRPSNMATQSYRIDPNTGQIINELSGEVVKDISGNPIQVKIPTQLPSNLLPFQNDNYPFLQQQQNRNQNAFPNQLQNNNSYGLGGAGQSPLDLLYNQNNLDTGEDPNY